jgi:hypothetical protein
MTLRTIDTRALSAALSAAEDAQTPLGEATSEALDAMFKAARDALQRHRLTLPNDDRWREVEAVFFGAIRDANREA